MKAIRFLILISFLALLIAPVAAVQADGGSPWSEILNPDGTIQTFSGCYRFHLARPDIQAVPPFMPLAIQSATVNSVANNSDQAALLKQACAGQ
jgi:hypothetical protein